MHPSSHDHPLRRSWGRRSGRTAAAADRAGHPEGHRNSPHFRSLVGSVEVRRADAVGAVAVRTDFAGHIDCLRTAEEVRHTDSVARNLAGHLGSIGLEADHLAGSLVPAEDHRSPADHRKTVDPEEGIGCCCYPSLT